MLMLYAHATTKLMSEGGDMRDGEAVTAAVRTTSFTGVGGTVVALDSNGDRVESYDVMNYLVGAEGIEYNGMTFEANATGFQPQEYENGYKFCERYSEVIPTIEASVDACKDKCHDKGCSFLTYYAGSHHFMLF